jgi:hypothetical protein
MKLTARSLPMTVLVYFCVPAVVVASLYAALYVLTPAVYASLQGDGERPVSRLEELVANAREVRKALATPLPPIEPLEPITSKPVRAVSAKAAKSPGRTLSAEARNAFASSSEDKSPRGGGSVDIERHRVQ